MDSRTTVGCKWWGLAIALAVEGWDVGSRARLAKATGDPEAWTAFAAIDMGKAGMAAGLGEFLAYVAEDPDHVDASRPCPGEPGYDPLVGRAAELSSRLIRGMLAGNPACLAPSIAVSPQQSQEKCSPAVIVPRHRTTAGPPDKGRSASAARTPVGQCRRKTALDLIASSAVALGHGRPL